MPMKKPFQNESPMSPMGASVFQTIWVNNMKFLICATLQPKGNEHTDFSVSGIWETMEHCKRKCVFTTDILVFPQISVVFTNRHCDVRDKAGVIKKSSTQQFTSNNKKTKKLFTSKYKTLLMKCECLKIPLVSMFRPLFMQPSRWFAKVSKHAHLW